MPYAVGALAADDHRVKESADLEAARELLERLGRLGLDEITPIEALNTLAEWKAFGDA